VTTVLASSLRCRPATTSIPQHPFDPVLMDTGNRQGTGVVIWIEHRERLRSLEAAVPIDVEVLVNAVRSLPRCRLAAARCVLSPSARQTSCPTGS
jgi:ABC-type antimicrobial peptide transport system ATPase subunit